MNTLKHRRYYPGGGGYSWEFLMVCRPVLQIVTLFQIKKCNLPPLFSDQASRNHTCFQTWPLCYHYFDQSAKQKKFFKAISNSHVSISFLLIWNWNYKYVYRLPYFPRKPYPTPDQNGQIEYPFSNQNGAKTLPNGAGHTYIAHIREYPPGFITKLWCWLLNVFNSTGS